MSKPLKLLIVDDSEEDATLLVEELKRGGYEPNFERVDTAKAMAAALTQPWDLVISDYSMPSFNAPEAIKLVKDNANDLPCIVMSGSIGEERAIEILRAGAADFILKGMTPRLLPAIARELRERDERRARRRAENALIEAEVKFQSLCESAVDAIFSFAQSGGILSWNEAAQETFGYPIDEMLGKHAEVLIARPYIEQYRSGLTLAKLKRTSRMIGKTLRVQGVKKDGIEFPIELSLASWQNGDERFYAAIVRDISDRERLEGQLRQSQKMEAIGQLAGGIAHDFNNLLTIINGRSQLMFSRIRSDDKMRKELELIYKTGERAATLTRQLLAFSRQQVLEPKVVDLNAVASNMDKMLQRLIRENVTLVAILDPGLRPVMADPGQIEQVILNLAVNARDAMPNGGKLTIETTNVELDEEYCQSRPEVMPGHFVMLAVSDNGQGMNAAVKSRIFEPFFTTKPQGKGTGLGLSTVFGIVKQSGGHIEVYSEVGKGTTFKIYLPQTTKDAPAMQSSDRLLALSRGNEVVLIVEDEDGVRDLAREMMTLNGYTVLTACHGHEALSICETHEGPIDLLLTDVVMPEMGGPELANRIRILRPKIKVLFSSGYTDHAIVHNGVLDVAVDFIQKPFTSVSLTQKVRDVLDKA